MDKDYNIYFCNECGKYFFDECVLGKWTTIQALERIPTIEEKKEINIIKITCNEHN